MSEASTIYRIPEANFSKFAAAIENLSKRSLKMVGAPVIATVVGREVQGEETFFNVALDAQRPSIAGWDFVARIDHSNETGNIVRVVPNGVAVPESYRSVAPNCDHCRINRNRRDTFVLHCAETGEFKQVGSTCLRDFFDGRDPAKIARLAELLGYADEAARAAETAAHSGLTDHRWIDLERFLAYVAMEVREHGWVSAKKAREEDRTSTREAAMWAYTTPAGNPVPTQEDVDLAAKALDWARGLDALDNLDDYQHNILVIAKALVIEGRSAGLAASIVGVYAMRNRPSSVDVGDFSGVVALLQRGGSKLRYPKITMSFDGGKPLVISLAGPTSRNAGSLYVTDGGPYENNRYYGRVEPTGRWTPGRAASPRELNALTEVLSRLSLEPAKTASAYGRLTGRCCFCNLPLKDARSTAVGYGATCAKNWGLDYPTMKQAQAA